MYILKLKYTSIFWSSYHLPSQGFLSHLVEGIKCSKSKRELYRFQNMWPLEEHGVSINTPKEPNNRYCFFMQLFQSLYKIHLEVICIAYRLNCRTNYNFFLNLWASSYISLILLNFHRLFYLFCFNSYMTKNISKFFHKCYIFQQFSVVIVFVINNWIFPNSTN